MFGGVFFIQILNKNNMKKLFLVSLIAVISINNSLGQLSINGHFYGEDAIKFYRYGNFGSARVMGMGGAFTALGGDLSSSYINPAGLGYYNKSEFSLSPYFINQNTNSSYIGQKTNQSSSSLTIGQIGAVFSKQGTGSRKKRSNWAISYNTLANFTNDFSYSGVNKRSSLTDYFAEKATKRGISSTALDDEFDSKTGLAQNGTAMMYQAFLIDPSGKAYLASELSVPVNQTGRVSETGNLGQINVGYGVNFDDRTYFGASLGIQNLNYNQITDHSEVFPNGKIFNSFDFGDELFVKGTGINLSLGAIFKVTENLRVGANLTSPTSMKIQESLVSNVSIRQKPNTFTTKFQEISTVPNDFNYKIISPTRANIAASLFLPKKIGVVSIEAEYVGYSRMNIKDNENARWSSEQKREIQNEFKDVVNLKAGTEIRVGIGRLRAGLNYLADPNRVNKNYNSKSSLVGSFGAGLRNNKYYVDVAYSRTMFDSAFTPYTLSAKEDYSSIANSGSKGILAFSIGTFF